MSKYLTVKNVLLNEIRSLSRRIDTLMESSQSELEKDFNKIKDIFKDCPKTKEDAILKGFKPRDNEAGNPNPTEFTDKSGKIVIEFESHKTIFKKYHDSKYAKYIYFINFDYKGSVYKEECDEYFTDLEQYGPEFSNYTFVTRSLYKTDGAVKEEISAYTKDFALKYINKPWFLLHGEKTIKKAKDMGFDLSGIESLESY